MDCINMSSFEAEEHCPVNPHNIAFFTEVLVDKKLKLPANKPPIEKIIDVKRQIFIKKVIPVPIKLCHDQIAGVKILATGFIQLEITYSTDSPEQNVHFACFEVPFEGLIMSSSCHMPIPLQDCHLKQFKLNVCIEHLETERVNPKKINSTIVLLLWLEHKDSECHETPKSEQHSDNLVSEGEINVFKEVSLSNILPISKKLPPAKKVLDTVLDIEIDKARVINTPLVTKICHFPIRKVIVTGKVLVTIKYVADTPGNQVFSISFTLPFNTLIEWPGGPPQQTPVCGSITTELLETELLDACHFFNQIVLRIDISKN